MERLGVDSVHLQLILIQVAAQVAPHSNCSPILHYFGVTAEMMEEDEDDVDRQTRAEHAEWGGSGKS